MSHEGIPDKTQNGNCSRSNGKFTRFVELMNDTYLRNERAIERVEGDIKANERLENAWREKSKGFEGIGP